MAVLAISININCFQTNSNTHSLFMCHLATVTQKTSNIWSKLDAMTTMTSSRKPQSIRQHFYAYRRAVCSCIFLNRTEAKAVSQAHTLNCTTKIKQLRIVCLQSKHVGMSCNIFKVPL